VIVLGLDTATPATAVGLLLPDGSTLSARDDPQPGQRPGHATRLLPLAEELLAQAGSGWSELQRIAVGLGPGTFTGLRVGIATARGLAQSLAVELVGVSSLDALAHRAAGAWRSHRTAGEWRPHRVAGAWPGNVLAAIDARRGEVFAAAYPSDGPPTAPRALAPRDVGELLAELRPSSEAPWLALGNGAVLYRSHLLDLGIEVPSADSPLHRIDGAAICELALDAPVCAPHTVLPDYLRRPDAEIALSGSAG
jgi:tRNA threonylcarbamoyladenosine biosynthesis protein TsaB